MDEYLRQVNADYFNEEDDEDDGEDEDEEEDDEDEEDDEEDDEDDGDEEIDSDMDGSDVEELSEDELPTNGTLIVFSVIKMF